MTPPQLDPDIRRLLDRLRRRVRLYVWAEGAAAALAVVGLAFWLGLALDWLLEPPPAARVVGLIAAGAVVLAVIYRFIVARAFARLSDASLALLLEKHAARFDDSLLTSVELAEASGRDESFSAAMLDHTRQQARRHVPEARVGKVFDRRPLSRKAAAAVLLLASIAAFGYFATEAFAFFVNQRVIALTDAEWPRRTRLVVEGFPKNEQGVRTMKVARGGSFDLQIKADNRMPTPPPRRVEIRYQLDDQSRGRADARRVGEAVAGRDDYQEYAYTFKDVFHSRTFDVLGGDDRVSGLRLEVVDSPEITAMTLHCEYPAYMGRAPRDLNVTGAMSIPRGTKVTLRATTNKNLIQVRILDPEANEPVLIDIAASAADRKRFEYALGFLNADRLLLLVLHDHDGIENREPYRLSLSAAPDEPPQVSVALRGIGTAVTPSARVPLVGTLADDYGVARVWFEHGVDEQKPAETPTAPDAAGKTEAKLDLRLDLEPLKLEPKQKLVLALKASDRYDLGDEPNVGGSQRFLLDVVTPEQLRSMLESRELMLRRRFETIYAELAATRDLIARVEFASESEDGGDGEENAEDDSNLSTEQRAERALARRRVRVARALQNVQRSGHETLAVATAFDDIYAEMVNNRIDTEDLKTRLVDSIAAPLKEIGGPLTQKLEQTLETLDAEANHAEAGPAARRAAVAQADAVLAAMKAVLDRMLELESYNEVMELLRGIINDQEQLNQQTDQQRKSKLKNLLED